MIRSSKKKRDIWTLISWLILFLYIIFLIFPLFNILKEAVIGKNGGFSLEYFQKFFGEKYYLATLGNSFKVSIVTTLVSLILGVPLAYFNTVYELKGRNFLQIMIILCSMSAPFIGAYSWILLLGRSGAITLMAKDVFGMQLGSIYGFHGIVLVLSTRMFPLVYLYVSGALKNMDRSLLEASQNLGCSKFTRFTKIIIPLIMPAMLASMLMVFMRAIADFGTPLLIGEGYRTFPVEIYKQYVGETNNNHNFAAAISIIAIVITALVFLIQKIAAKAFTFTMSSLNPIQRKKIKGLPAVLMYVYSYLLVGISMLPQLFLIYTSFRNTTSSGSSFVKGYSLKNYQIALERSGQAIPNTLLLGGVSLLIIIVIAVFVAYLVTRRQNVLNSSIDTLSMIPYIIPGSVVGIALVISFNKAPLLLTGTMLIMIVSMCIRRLPYTVRSSVATLQQIPVTIEEASISLGASKLKTFFRVTVPMMTNGIVAGAILSWVTIITELSASIILYNSNTITLTLSIYSFVSRGTDGPAAATSAILTLFTIISLLLFTKISKDDEVIV